GLACAAAATLSAGTSQVDKYVVRTVLPDSLWGLLVCGGCMLVCYVFFRIGGGDVKLMAMIGSFMGWEPGLRVLLWSFVLGGAMAVVILIWRVGAWTLLRRIALYLWAAVRLRGFSHVQGGLGAEAQTSLYLAPSALAAVILVQFEVLERMALI
ncbi:MAG: A24 family peptidase, partial [Planctomycetota bacterium]|nr:A24 family peptidase [Planctomycetota bacterium]